MEGRTYRCRRRCTYEPEGEEIRCKGGAGTKSSAEAKPGQRSVQSPVQGLPAQAEMVMLACAEDTKLPGAARVGRLDQRRRWCGFRVRRPPAQGFTRAEATATGLAWSCVTLGATLGAAMVVEWR